MKRLIQKSLLVIPVLALGVSVLLGGVARAAGTANVYLSPASGSYTVGNTVTMDIYEDSGSDSVNAVQANLSYNQGLLTFSGITSSSAFTVDAQSTGGAGSVKIARGTAVNASVSGLQLVATVKFTASAAGGAAVSFASGTEVDRSSDSMAETLTTSGGTYTVNAAATPPAPPSAPGPSPSPTPSSPKASPPPPSPKSSPPATPSPTPAATPPASPTTNPSLTIKTTSDPSDVTVSNLTDKSATISWKTSVPTTTILSYGLTEKLGYTSVDSNLTTDHRVVLAAKNLSPGKTYHYVIKGVAANGSSFSSNDTTFDIPAAAAKKSVGKGAVIAALVVLGLAAAGGGSVFWVKKAGVKPQWSGYEPAAKPEVKPPPGAPAGQVVRPAGSGEVKPGENVIKPGSGPNPPAA